MSKESFIDPLGILKACAMKKMTKRTIMIVPVHELENLCSLCKVFFINYALSCALSFAAFNVLAKSIAIVIGPTPPGTGVI